ncbi:right-handed parallel beta-helix repeat-containing protein [Paenibacillus naphthalenovorans]|uniref:right-handed parallel beta-helix repeat-containing protein n=1 Tax=Paenibacillus naphthalenovorans TaxID=162209 RepID=UPI00088EA292|nr:NosD domain-containing protein [Paenibacillus naphthalenovorans]SDJ89140.1 nitrous oxidase accessory protein [Paenibacillus naphthalenovorans]
MMPSKILKRGIVLGMTIFTVLSIVFFRIDSAYSSALTEGHSLQQRIDETPSGGTVKLPAGMYNGPVTLNKPIRIIADGDVQLRSDASVPTIRIQAEGVVLQGLRIVHHGREDTAAVLITANGATLESLDIQTASYGIVVRDSGRHEILDSGIRWTGSDRPDGGKLSDRRNGIDLLNSHDNRIVGNVISSMNDGIYMENSHRNYINGNRFEHSRYGIHSMYIDGTEISGNQGAFNVTGAMIMGVKDAVVRDNTFVKQSENVNSQGLLFYDVHTSRIFNNKVEGNRVGLYVEKSNRNEFQNNDVLQNFVGVQFLESEGNRFTANRFIGNVIEAEANGSKNNTFEGNYWEAFRGLDTNGDGYSDLAYAINPFFQRLTSATPAFQLFFQSPGLLFLESLNTAGKEEWTKDKAPYLKPDFRTEAARSSYPGSSDTLALGIMLLFAAVFTIYYLGVRRG